MKNLVTSPTMFSTIFSSFGKLFRRAKVVRASAKPVKRTMSLEMEHLEAPEVPTAPLAAQMQSLKVFDFQTALNQINAAQQAVCTNFNQQQADLKAARSYLTQGLECVLWEYHNGFETLAQAQHDVGIVTAIWAKAGQATPGNLIAQNFAQQNFGIPQAAGGNIVSSDLGANTGMQQSSPNQGIEAGIANMVPFMQGAYNNVQYAPGGPGLTAAPYANLYG